MPTILQASATPNNQCLVWDRLVGNWIGTWEGDVLTAGHFFTYMDGDTERAAVISPDGVCYRLMVDNCTDDDTSHEGMVFEAAVDCGDQESVATEIEITFEHCNGAWATFVEADGIGEHSGPHQVVPDYQQYTTFGATAWDRDNSNDDQMEPHREDYALLLHTDGMNMSARKGWGINARQTYVQRVRMRKPFKSLLVRVETMRGWVGVRKIAARMRRKPFARGRKL